LISLKDRFMPLGIYAVCDILVSLSTIRYPLEKPDAGVVDSHAVVVETIFSNEAQGVSNFDSLGHDESFSSVSNSATTPSNFAHPPSGRPPFIGSLVPS